MALWGAIDNSANAPKWSVLSGLGSSANGFTAYQNTTTGAFVTGVQLGIEGVNTVEVANTQLANGGGLGKAAHTGWNLRKQGTGFVSDIAISSGGTGYNANGFLVFTGGGGSGANASFTRTIGTPVQNVISTVTLVSQGSNFTTTPTVTAQGSNISAATFTVTMGGRANRVMFETLCALNNVA